VGYAPEQPVPYSHQLHAGQLGMDCRYCHNNVERSAYAGVPSTQTCMNCHANVKKDSPILQPIRDSWKTGDPVPWVRIHKVADYAYFDHSAHLTRGVGCVSCHGRVDQMIVVRQQEPLNMEWCLNCHRNPEPSLRPLDKITDMDWKASDMSANEKQEIAERLSTLQPPVVNCAGCHR
jgi:NAD-dependent SIR2 family protein deacetylase